MRRDSPTDPQARPVRYIARTSAVRLPRTGPRSPVQRTDSHPSALPSPSCAGRSQGELSRQEPGCSSPSVRKLDHHLGAVTRAPQRLEHLGDLIDRDNVGYHRLRPDFAAGQSVDGFVEVGGVIAEHEIDAGLLHDALDWTYLIRLHTDADHDDLSARRDHAHRLIERAFDADTLEDQFGAASGQLANLIDRRRGFGIDDNVGAEL